jgi:hypothetical protein
MKKAGEIFSPDKSSRDKGSSRIFLNAKARLKKVNEDFDIIQS